MVLFRLQRETSLQLSRDRADDRRSEHCLARRAGLPKAALVFHWPLTNQALCEKPSSTAPGTDRLNHRRSEEPPSLPAKDLLHLRCQPTGCSSAKLLEGCRTCTTEKSTATGKLSSPWTRTPAGLATHPSGPLSSSTDKPASWQWKANLLRRSLCRAYTPRRGKHKAWSPKASTFDLHPGQDQPVKFGMYRYTHSQSCARSFSEVCV